jgi:ribonuclease T1
MRSSFVLLLSAVFSISVSSHAHTGRNPSPSHIPRKAVEVYQYVLKNGTAPPGYVGGRVWQNREKRLPRGGDYHEFDVNPKMKGRNRGAERIVVDFRSWKGWYTPDHYITFILLKR